MTTSFLVEALQNRGVYCAPCLSHRRETILYAVDHNHCLLENGWIYVPPGENPFVANAALWERLNVEDPVLESEELFATG